MRVWRPTLLWAAGTALVASGLAVALAVTHEPDSPRPAGVTGPPCEEPLPLDIVLIIDRSGSMGDPTNVPLPPTSGGRFRIEWAKDAANDLVDALAAGDDDLSPHRLSVIAYDGGNADDGAAFATVDLSLGAGSSAAAAHAGINGITPEGSTYIAPGLSAASGELAAFARPEALQVAILLSDGRNFANPGEEPDTADRRDATVAAVPALHALTDTVYAIGIGDETLTAPPAPDWAPLDVPLLQLIAADGPPGRYINVAVDLPDLLTEIVGEIAPCTPTPTASPTATNTPTATSTSTPTPSSTPTPTATPPATPTASSTPTPTATPSPTVTPTSSPSPTGTRPPTLTPTDTPSATPTATATPTRTSEVLGPTPSPTDGNTPTATGTFVSSVLAVPPAGPRSPTALPATGGGSASLPVLWAIAAPVLATGGLGALLWGLRRRRAS